MPLVEVWLCAYPDPAKASNASISRVLLRLKHLLHTYRVLAITGESGTTACHEFLAHHKVYTCRAYAAAGQALLLVAVVREIFAKFGSADKPGFNRTGEAGQGAWGNSGAVGQGLAKVLVPRSAAVANV